MLTHAPWVAVDGLRHGFLDRRECAGDVEWDATVAGAGTPLPIAVPRQVHGVRVVTAGPAGEPPEADGVVTGERSRLVGVLTADCVPVLLVDPRRRLAAAVHAGWRGASGGVLEAALAHLASAFGATPAGLEAAIGPAVGGCCYEVGSEVVDAFRARTGRTTEAAWTTRAGRLHVDLRLAATLLLRDAGVAGVAVLGPCTACDPTYCSYRRDGAGAGRQLSFVGWA